MILDDTFVSYDEERLESVMEWLAKWKTGIIVHLSEKRDEDTFRNGS